MLVTGIRRARTRWRVVLLLVCLWTQMGAVYLAGQRTPFVSITVPGAPKGCFYPFEDSRGGLWLAGCETGREGFYFFDGSRFFAPLDTPFPKLPTTGMAEDTSDGIWLATSDGIYRFLDGRLSTIAPGEGTRGILRIAPDTFLVPAHASGQVSSPTRLLRITRGGEGWKVEALMPSMPPVRLQLDARDHILFGCEGGWCEFDRAAALAWRPGQVLPVTQHAVRFAGGFANDSAVVWRDAAGCIWMRSQIDAISECPGDVGPTAVPAGMVDLGQPSILQTSDDRIALPSFSKMALGRPGSMRATTAMQGYPSTGLALIAGDDSLWLSGAQGLSVLPLHITQEFWTEQDGLEGNTWSITRVGEKMLAIAGDSIRVLKDDRSGWQIVARVRGASSLLPGPNGSLLVASHAEGVVRIALSGQVLGRSSAHDIARLIRTRNGQVWAAGDGIFRTVVAPGRVDLQPSVSSDRQVADVAEDSHGDLWACSIAGVSHRDNHGWRLVAQTGSSTLNDCHSIAIDAHDNVWFGESGGARYAVIEHPTATPVARYLQDVGAGGGTNTNFLLLDSRGWLWRGTPTGVFVAGPEGARRGEWIALDHASGFSVLDANQHAFFEDRDGSVWFGEDNHVVHVTPPRDLVQPEKAPSLFVSAMALEGEQPKLSDGEQMIRSGKPISALLGSLQMDRRSALRIRYRVLPQGTAWQSGNGLDLPLGKVGWGAHTLEVKAQLADGPWSPVSSRSFTVVRPGWLAWPALGGYAALGGAGVAAGYRRRRRRAERSKKLLPELTEWRLAALSPELQQMDQALLDDRFEVGRVVARGGFATVLAGRDLRQAGLPCAIKIFRRELMDNAWMARRFRHEVLALETVHHANVVRVYGHGATESGAAYLVMEYVDGKTLRQLLDEGPLPILQTAAWLAQIGRALDVIHRHNICHRDLKPENLMVRNHSAPGEEIVLIDFSIAIVQDPDETLHGLSRAAGTLHYMAPEQAIGYADPSTDIYSLAKVAIEMLAGRRLSELLPDASMDLPERVRELLTRLELSLSATSIDLLGSALQFDPARRPKDAGAFATAIAKDLVGAVAG